VGVVCNGVDFLKGKATKRNSIASVEVAGVPLCTEQGFRIQNCVT
jgi:hypothetical protein